MMEPRETTPTHGDSDTAEPPSGGGVRRAVTAVVLVLATLTVAWWAVVRVTAGARVVGVYETPEAVASPEAPASPEAAANPGPAGIDGRPREGALPGADTVRVLTWNIAHGRGDRLQGGLLNNYRRGDRAERASRLARIAGVLRESDADIVVLNEVDFHAAWSGGLNQAEALARAAGYPYRLEQRNFDFSVLFADYAFGNAVLARLPLSRAREVPIPPQSRLEAVLIGAKTASAVRAKTGVSALTVAPIHLEFRSERTRRAAVAALRALAGDNPALVLAGDFNTSPAGWPGREGPTAVGQLLEAGFRSPRAEADPGAVRLTFPSPDPATAIDWVLAAPPIRILEARVLSNAAPLSDHLPVLAVLEVPFASRSP